MSVVVARRLHDRCEFAADSIRVRGWTQRRDGTKFSKLFRTTSGLVVGGTGFAEDLSLMSLFLDRHRLEAPRERAVLDLFADFFRWRKLETEKTSLDTDWLLGAEGRLFSVISWHVAEVETFEAIGAGADFALAALWLGHNAKRAVEVAIELSAFCEPPIIEMESP